MPFYDKTETVDRQFRGLNIHQQRNMKTLINIMQT